MFFLITPIKYMFLFWYHLLWLLHSCGTCKLSHYKLDSICFHFKKQNMYFVLGVKQGKSLCF